MTATTLALPLLEKRPGVLFPTPPSPAIVHGMTRGSVLQSVPGLGDDVLALSLTRGCYHRCAFCAVRGAAAYTGDDVLTLYKNAPEQLAAELAARERKPRAVFISPNMDPFPPDSDVQAVSARVVAVLAEQGVASWLMTRGLVRPAALQVLQYHRRLVKVTVPMITLRRDLQRSLERLTASPRLRLRQIATLRRLGIGVQVAIEPLLPDLTDTTENLEPLLRALAEVGVRQVSAGYLFLRDRVAENLARALGQATFQLIEEEFKDGPFLGAAGLGRARFLSRARRQRGYSRLMALAAAHGITVSISRLSNPDFAPPMSVARQAPRRLLPQFLQQQSAQANPEAN